MGPLVPPVFFSSFCVSRRAVCGMPSSLSGQEVGVPVALALYEKTCRALACLAWALALFLFSSCLIGTPRPLFLLSRSCMQLTSWCTRDGLTAGMGGVVGVPVGFLWFPPYSQDIRCAPCFMPPLGWTWMASCALSRPYKKDASWHAPYHAIAW